MLPQGNAAMKTPLPVTWPGSPAAWDAPMGLWVNPLTKDVFVADRSNLVVVPGNGSGQVSFVGGAGYFSGLSDVFGDTQGTLWAVDKLAAKVYRITDGGTNFSLLAPGSWSEPYAVTVSPEGVVFVSDFGLSWVAAIDSWGWGSTTFITDQLSQPTGIWFSLDSNLYVCEYNNMYVARFVNGSGSAILVTGNIHERPTDVGGSPWSSIWDTEQNSLGGLFNIGPTYDSGSVGSWSNAQGVWLDC